MAWGANKEMKMRTKKRKLIARRPPDFPVIEQSQTFLKKITHLIPLMGSAKKRRDSRKQAVLLVE